MPAYEEISHTPLFIYDPVSRIQGERRKGLTSAIDLPVTILEFFGIDIPKDMQGYSLLPLIRENRAERKAALFGYHGAQTAVTDGEYVYFRAPLASEEQNMYEYTLMPTRMRRMFSVEDLKDAELVPPLSNSKGCPVLKTRGHGSYVSPVNFGTKLYHVTEDPRQKEPLDDPVTETRMARLLKDEMEKADSPEEQFVRLGLMIDLTPENIVSQREKEEADDTPDLVPGASWTKEARNVMRVALKMMPKEGVDAIVGILKALHARNPEAPISYEDIISAVKMILPKESADQTLYYMYMISRAE